VDLGRQRAGGQADAGAAAEAAGFAEGVGDGLVGVGHGGVGVVVGTVVEGVGDGRVLHPGPDVVHQRSPHLGEATPVGVHQDRHEAHQREDDQDRQEGVGGALRVAAAPQVSLFEFGDPATGVDLGIAAVARQLVLSVKLCFRGLDPLDEGDQVAVALPRVVVQVDLFGLLSGKDFVDPLHRVLVQTLDLVPLDVEHSELFDALKVKVQIGQLVITKIEVLQLWKVAKRVFVYRPNFVLFQMQFPQLVQICGKQNVFQILKIPFGVDNFSESVCKVQFFQRKKVGQQAGVVVPASDLDVVVVQDQPLDIFNLVKCLSQNVGDPIVAEIDNFEGFVRIPNPEQIPVQHRQVVSIEEKHLCAFWQHLQGGTVCELGVCAVDHVNVAAVVPVGVRLSTALAFAFKRLRTARAVRLVSVGGVARVSHDQGRGE